MECSGTIIGTTTDPLSYTVQGSYRVTWHFNDGNGNEATQQQAVIVTLLPTILTYSGDTSGVAGRRVALKAVLMATSTASPLEGKPVTFTLGNQSADAVTNRKGVASTSLVLNQAMGTYTVNAIFSADCPYAATSISSQFIINPSRKP